MKRKLTTSLIWIALVVVVILFVVAQQNREPAYFEEFPAFLGDVQAGNVSSVHVEDNQITVTLHDTSERYWTLGVLDDETRQLLSQEGVRVKTGEERDLLSTLITSLLPILIIVVVVFWLFSRRMKGGMGEITNFRQSKARLIGDNATASFADVGGCSEAKDVLEDVVDFLRDPERWVTAGARLPRGVLLEGPPGCGKTLLARAVAGETNAQFYEVSASEFVEMFVGVGAARVRDLFEKAAKEPPAVIFVDELDAVGRRRGSGIGSAHDEREQTLNQLLVCLDGFRKDDRVVVIGATNRPDILDRALLRPGRFDRRIKIGTLSTEDRRAILEIHSRGKTMDSSVDLAEIARLTDGFTGAKLENLTNEAVLLAVRRSRKSASKAPTMVVTEDFREAFAAGTTKISPFDRVDSLLIESLSQVSEPTGRAVVRLTLQEGTVVEGEVVWANASLIKLRTIEAPQGVFVLKTQIATIKAIEGTETAERQDVQPDTWAKHTPELA